MNEKLSALMDGELNEAETSKILSQLEKDKNLRAAWSRYHLAASVLHDDITQLSNPGLADKIAKEIAGEPVIVSPGWWRQSNKKAIKLAGSFAIAASVAAIAVISLRVDSPDQANRQSIASLEPISSGDFIRASGTRWSNGTSSTGRALNMYLVEHSEFSPASNFKGMMGYGRIAGYDMSK
ncbi:MAG: sigma-E factor negative regulatory protein [Acidiferrobacterales bacterium]